MPEVGDFELQGLEVSVWSEAGDYSAIGYIVDQIESLVDEWFPGKGNPLTAFSMS